MQKNIDYLDYETTFQSCFVKDYWNQKPCIIRGCVSQWSANTWDFPHLKKIPHKGADRGNLNKVQIRDPQTEIWQKCQPNHLPQIRKKLNINTLEYQADEWLFPLTHPEMLEEIKIPSCLQNPQWLNMIPLPLRPIYPRILIGYADTGSQLHIDVCMTPNWIGLVKGVKRWFVVDPQEGQKLEYYLDEFTPNTSELKEKVDVYYEFDLQAGEIVYLPGKWLHQVYNVSDSIAITYNLFNPIQATAYGFDSIIYNFENNLEKHKSRLNKKQKATVNGQLSQLSQLNFLLDSSLFSSFSRLKITKANAVSEAD